MVDRLLHHAEIIAIEGTSYRLKEAQERAEQRSAQRRKAKSAGAQVMKPPELPSGLRQGIPFLLPAHWSPEQALAVFELLDDLREQIWHTTSFSCWNCCTSSGFPRGLRQPEPALRGSAFLILPTHHTKNDEGLRRPSSLGYFPSTLQPPGSARIPARFFRISTAANTWKSCRPVRTGRSIRCYRYAPKSYTSNRSASRWARWTHTLELVRRRTKNRRRGGDRDATG